jgi:rubrerythrin
MTMLTAHAALRWALQIEANGRAFYTAVAATMADGNARLLFADLAEQEGRHYRTFERLLEHVPAGPAPSEEERQRAETRLRALYTNALYGGEDRGLALAAEASDEASALRAAIAFENDTLLFFQEMRDQVAPAHQATLTAIIGEEQEHLRQLERALQDLPWVS